MNNECPQCGAIGGLNGATLIYPCGRIEIVGGPVERECQGWSLTREEESRELEEYNLRRRR